MGIMGFKPRRRTVLRWSAAVVLIGALAVSASVGWVRYQASGREYAADAVPATDVAIVFGAQVYDDGQPSPYLAARLDIGRQLLESGKVRALLLTGDNGRRTYDEPEAMRRYLVGKGVPAAKIALDYAGFDTYQSCVRANKIFGVRQAIVVTQDFSVPRTVALCRSAGIETAAVADHSQPHEGVWIKCWVRDQIAAIKAVWEMATEPDPKFLGNVETSVRDAIASSPR
ncbi:vancomycin permeability regulator SanA [Nocardia goodfellowii]|uniref:Vancomycin permeability regulator SanA n=2 Tax=Nocardia goodfellowii TaxID=882446 RepID=A0ABS4QQ95_9NOCA|nr:vancomycin permeability regulator SanA [Nocardia goodfellowii]